MGEGDSSATAVERRISTQEPVPLMEAVIGSIIDVSSLFGDGLKKDELPEVCFRSFHSLPPFDLTFFTTDFTDHGMCAVAREGN